MKALTFSAGELSPAFHKDTHEYTLTVDKGTDSAGHPHRQQQELSGQDLCGRDGV
ncbi:MAG: hypothetical protein ACLUIX_10450 [Oscillospiraceae bacterium]